MQYAADGTKTSTTYRLRLNETQRMTSSIAASGPCCICRLKAVVIMAVLDANDRPIRKVFYDADDRVIRRVAFRNTASACYCSKKAK